MASTNDPFGQSGGLSAESLADWVTLNQRRLIMVGAGLAVAAGIVLFWRESVKVKNRRADTAFESAQSAFFAGNAPLAKGDLEKLATRYPGTPGAVQGTMLLAQILYGEGKYDEGMRRLGEVARTGAGKRFAASIEELIAAGYADARKFEDAARHYLAAAEQAQFEGDKLVYRAEAARAFQMGGKTAEARAIWAELAANPESPVLSEARVRLGEIDATPAPKS